MAVTHKLNVPQSESKRFSQCYDHIEIINQNREGNGTHLRIRLSASHANDLLLARA